MMKKELRKRINTKIKNKKRIIKKRKKKKKKN